MADYARGQRLRELREQSHESQETAAYAVGVSAKSLREWEHGGKIRWENAKRLAEHYGVDPEGLVSREEDEPSLNGDAPLTQLDRIEEMLNEIHRFLLGDGRDEEAVAGVADRLLPKDESPQRSGVGRPRTQRGAGRRKSA